MKVFSLIAIATLAGCASSPDMVWVRDGSTEDEFMRDRGQCIQAMYSVPLADNFQKMAVYSGCMQGKGWRSVPKT